MTEGLRDPTLPHDLIIPQVPHLLLTVTMGATMETYELGREYKHSAHGIPLFPSLVYEFH